MANCKDPMEIVLFALLMKIPRILHALNNGVKRLKKP